jgi:CheY-like chemotaxis protein
MTAVVGTALELTQPLLERRPRLVELALPEVPPFVLGDAVRLAQVVCNLLANAAKFTPPDGRIALSLRQDGAWVELVVEDSGSGIAAELLPRVFDLFSQGEQAIDRRSGGLGLGLAIVKTLVHLHGGTVSAASDGSERGSRFVVRLPAAEAPALAAPLPSAPVRAARRSARILLVDDNRDALEMLGALLREAGHQVHSAGDAAEALRALDGFVPELALLDIGLPGMDGYQLATRLRGDPRCAGLRLVALTGYGRQPDRDRALAMQFDEHLVKPVAADRLLEAVEHLLSSPTLRSMPDG